jgi:hypothetical protein
VREQEPRARAEEYHDRQIEEVVHDPYLARSKPLEPALCPQCGVVYHRADGSGLRRRRRHTSIYVLHASASKVAIPRDT